MTETPVFGAGFDRAIRACATAQLLVVRSVEASTRARDLRTSAIRIRRSAVESRDAWRGADRANAIMRTRVIAVARSMRAAGATEAETATAVRGRMRFVLYDGGLDEREAEPLVARSMEWVAECFRAA